MARKTIDVEKVKKAANGLLAFSEEDISDYFRINQDVKQGIVLLLEYILHDTGNYNGFNYIEWAKNGGYERYLEAKKTNKDVDSSDFLGEEYDRFYY